MSAAPSGCEDPRGIPVLHRLSASLGNPDGMPQPSQSDPDGLPVTGRIRPARRSFGPDEFMGSALQIADFVETSLASCRVDRELYGINLGNTSHSLIYSRAAFEKAKVEKPVIGRHGTGSPRSRKLMKALTSALSTPVRMRPPSRTGSGSSAKPRSATGSPCG